jgi:hypothetical protein
MEVGMMGTNRSISLLLLTVSGTAGIAALFLPFTWGVSPASAVFAMAYWQLAIPFFLSVLVSAASVRWMISGLPSRPERAIAYVASSMMAFSTLSLYLDIDAWPSGMQEWLSMTIPLLTLLLGVYVVIKNLRNKGPKEVSAVMAMQIAYLSNALLCLIGFFGEWQIGAYFVLVTSIVYLLQIVLASVKLGILRGGGTNSSE